MQEGTRSSNMLQLEHQTPFSLKSFPAVIVSGSASQVSKTYSNGTLIFTFFFSASLRLTIPNNSYSVSFRYNKVEKHSVLFFPLPFSYVGISLHLMTLYPNCKQSNWEMSTLLWELASRTQSCKVTTNHVGAINLFPSFYSGVWWG